MKTVLVVCLYSPVTPIWKITSFAHQIYVVYNGPWGSELLEPYHPSPFHAYITVVANNAYSNLITPSRMAHKIREWLSKNGIKYIIHCLGSPRSPDFKYAGHVELH